ncbi:MAG: putative nicotinate-nucleotide adenylyltransferase [Alphaproteobacteria bacterium]|nr:MAG: putative nicotinate-nucleotide adenylyltransferase [Alphaproteobacteria bacterium]
MTTADDLNDPAYHIPPTADGMRVGLFGGSFNPPHEGHLRVSEHVLKRARLDRIWWLVTPGNPLKDHGELAPLDRRIALCRGIARHPRIVVTALEARYSVRYTADTLAILKRLRPRVRFVWIMGADNLASFHHWQDWRRIAAMMPMIVVDRPGSTLSFLSARAAIALARWRVSEDAAAVVADLTPPAWTFLHGPRLALSSTAIRAASRTAATAR